MMAMRITMATTRTETNPLRAQNIHHKEAGNLGLTYFVYLVDGGLQEVAPATGLRLANAEVLFLLGELVVNRLPREAVCFVARTRCPPAMA